MQAWDDISGVQLNTEEVQKARQKEMDYVRGKPAWKKISRSVAKANVWKIIRVKWLDINKGDDDNPALRSRIVGMEFNDCEMEGLFGGTPPLEALRHQCTMPPLSGAKSKAHSTGEQRSQGHHG